MSTIRSSALLVCTLAAACGGDPTPDPTTTKDEARAQASLEGKADGSRRRFDFCGAYGWYGDGVCDDFCLDRDPDCATDDRTPELGGHPGVVRDARTTMSAGIALSEAQYGPTLEAKYELGDDDKLSLSIYPAGHGIALDAERNLFQELAGDPTAATFAGALEVFHDQEHLTRSARDLTLVQLSRATLLQTVRRLERYGRVYWAIPTIQQGRAGYGLYVLADNDRDGHADQSVYVFVDGGGSAKRQLADLGTGPGAGASDARTPELGDDLRVLRQSRITMSQALRQLEAQHGPAIEAKFELGDDGKLSLSIYPVSEPIGIDAQRQRFFELAGDPTAATFAPEQAEFKVPDEEHLTRAARDLTLVQTARMPLRAAVEAAERKVPGGFVYWAIPTLRDTRAGYGVYVYGADGGVHYLFIS